MSPIKLAVTQIGSNADVARLCGVRPQMVSQWIHDVRPVSPRCALLIEAHPNVTVTRHELRADIFGLQQPVTPA